MNKDLPPYALMDPVNRRLRRLPPAAVPEVSGARSPLVRGSGGHAASGAPRQEELAWAELFQLFAHTGRPLQVQIREIIVSAIVEGRLSPGARLPSNRRLSDLLDVARNTVVLAIQQLCEEGFLVARERSGYFVAPCVAKVQDSDERAPAKRDGTDWGRRVDTGLSGQRNIQKPRDWLRYPFPFLFGQFDPSLFPTNHWRECVRNALSVLEIYNWARDFIDGDDPELIEQLRLHVLPRRGIFARSEEIIITLGAQNGLALIAQLLFRRSTVVGMEDPGFPDARNLFRLMSDKVHPLPVDNQGLILSADAASCDYLFVTPCHQCPTTVSMRAERRNQLMAFASQHDIIIIEDDYEGLLEAPHLRPPALKSGDREERVLYVGSFSKTVAPGLRLGYVVAPEAVAKELRALRRLTMRHPPVNNQRAAALFIGLGHFNYHLRRLSQALRERDAVVRTALQAHMRDCTWTHEPGSSSYWVRGPDGVDCRDLAAAAKATGVLVEPGDVFFADARTPCPYFRLGFLSIPAQKIECGIAQLSGVLRSMIAATAV